MAKAHQGDKEARDTLVEENLGLIWSIVKRFNGRGHDLEDLFQIGSIGLMKAIDKFDSSFDVRFSTYAVPMITGEIKRFLRDDGMIKVSRTLKETAYKAHVTREVLEKKMGREPTLEEVSMEIGVTQEDIILAMESNSEIESLYKTIYQGDGNPIYLMDKLEERENKNDKLIDHIILEDVLKTLDEKERQIIHMRYFEDKTQSQIAQVMGISQVQVSRLEKKILKNLRGKL
ncbi:MAG TPA: RNA polymerase sporulation sigma factor SigF [Candidatus Merdenecus merdavium]|nr:RNA polymerase sporulation sigma factor SigF [Candidatus Merdenecus merdavium]